MKRVFILIVFTGLMFYLFHSYFEEKRVLRIGVECDYVPNSWLETVSTNSNLPIFNEPGHYAEGYDIQIAKLVAEAIGAELEVKKIVWEDLLPSLNRHEIDAIFSGMLDTPQRRERAAFSVPYDAVDNEYAVIVNQNSRFLIARTINDFAGARMVGQKGTHLDDVINQMKGVVHLEPPVSVTETVNMVNNRRADGAVINVDTAQSYLRKYPNLHLVRFHKEDGFQLDYTGTCAGVRKGDTQLLAEINKALNGISKVERQRIMDRSLGRALNHITH